MSDADLKARVEGNKAKKVKYEKVCRAISSRGLSTDVDTSQLTTYIKKCETYIKAIDGDEGYGSYLDGFKKKLEEEKKIFQEFKDYIKDANSGLKTLYTTLQAEIASLEAQIQADRSAYNKDKRWFWEQI